jgi:two-component system, OmpR family, sensor histidine kinase ResE
VTRPRALGLQVWLVGALLAVGMAASLAVLLVVLPTLEGNVRNDRAERESAELISELTGRLNGMRLRSPDLSAELQRVAEELREDMDAQVQITFSTNPLEQPRIVTAPDGAPLVQRGIASAVTGSGVAFDDDRSVIARAPFRVGTGALTVTAAREVTGLAPELAIVRQRVILAMIVVLGLATLAGVAIARVLGGRIRRLASTAATLAGGDLSARYPRGRIAPEEIVTLGESLNGMAGRLQSLVDEITGERDRDRAMIGSLAEGVLAVRPDGTVTVANEAATRLLGLPPGPEPLRLDALPAALLDAVLAARVPGGEPLRRLVALPSGTEVELHAARISGDEGAGTVITMRDVTEQRRLDRARRDLVANVSHELKTPIAALKGFLELLEDGAVDERHRREFLAAMTQETGRLERLVEEQLQLARLDSGALPLEREVIDLADLAGVVVAPRVPLARREGIALAVTRAAADPVPVEVDPARVEQILLILLDNALRHTPAGGRVDVIVDRDGQDGTLAVRDTGEGIPAEAQPFVFDRFYRGDPSREGRSAGLGLAIARGLAAAHRGSLDLRSQPGEGSTFTLRLPLRDAGAVTEEHPIPDLSGVGPPDPPPGG